MNWKDFFRPNRYKLLILVIIFIFWMVGIQYLLPSTITWYIGGSGRVDYSPLYFLIYPIMIVLSLPFTIVHSSGFGDITLVRLIPYNPVLTGILIIPVALAWHYVLSCCGFLMILEYRSKKPDDLKRLKFQVLFIVIILAFIGIGKGIVILNQPAQSDSYQFENAAVIAEATDEGMINIWIESGGQRYTETGYTQFEVYLGGQLVSNLPDSWKEGQNISVGINESEYLVGGAPLSEGDYEVVVTIFDSVVYDAEISVFGN